MYEDSGGFLGLRNGLDNRSSGIGGNVSGFDMLTENPPGSLEYTANHVTLASTLREDNDRLRIGSSFIPVVKSSLNYEDSSVDTISSNWTESFGLNSSLQSQSLSIFNSATGVLTDYAHDNRSAWDIFSTDSFFNDTPMDYFDSPNATNSTEISDTGPPYSTVVTILISVAVAVLVVLTAGGNLLVLISFKVDRTLHTISNYFLLSLAVADTTIGFVSIPLYTLYLLKGYWPLGPIVCDIWLSLDYGMSNASVWNLFVICIDRYLSITRPLSYRANRTPRKAAMMIAGAWLVSAVLWIPLIWIWPFIKGKRTVPDTACWIQFLVPEEGEGDTAYNYVVNLTTAFLAFYGPVIIMCSLYFKIFLETKKRQKELATLTQSKNKSWKKKSTSSMLEEDVRHGRHRGLMSFSGSQDLESVDDDSGEKSKFYKLIKCCRIDRDTTDSFEESSGSDPPTRVHTSTPPSSSRISQVVKHSNFKRDWNSNHGSLQANGGPSMPAREVLGLSNIPLITIQSTMETLVASPDDPPTSTSPLIRTTSFSKSMPALDQSLEDESSDDMDKDMLYSVLIKLPPENTDSKASIRMFPSRIPVGMNSPKPNKRTPQSSENNIGDDPPRNGANPPQNGRKSATLEHHPPKTNNHVNHSRTYSTPDGGDTFSHTNSTRMAFLYKARMQQAKKKRLERKQDKKAAKTLSAILLAFILTWAPYNITVVLNTFRPGTVPESSAFYSLGYMLCYINSTINPLCYALCNAQFRKTFWRILTCKFQKRDRAAAMNQARARMRQMANIRNNERNNQRR